MCTAGHKFPLERLHTCVVHEPTFVLLLKSCIKLKDLEKGYELHDAAIKTGLLDRNYFVGGALVDMYGKCCLLAEAHIVADKLPVRDVVSWTALIAGYADLGHGDEALRCLKEMQDEGVSPNAVTHICSLKACGSIQALVRGQEIHSEIERLELIKRSPFVGSTLVDMYAKCGFPTLAQEVFDKLLLRDVVSWTALIAGYAECGPSEKALESFKQMQVEGLFPNAVTIVCMLKACSSLRLIHKGQELHIEVERQHLLGTNEIIAVSLISMYIKCGLMKTAQEVFDKLPYRCGGAWTALITGYTQQGCWVEACECFDQMQCEGVSSNATVLVCCLKACYRLGVTDKFQELLVAVEQRGLPERNIFVGSTLVEVYVKSGLLAKANDVFDCLPHRDIVVWTSLVAGYTDQGYGEEAIQCLEQVLQEGGLHNLVALICGLRACGTTRDLGKGLSIHARIQGQGLADSDNTVGNTLIDMYAKCGLLAKAQRVFDDVRERDVVSWTALIAGHAEHGHATQAHSWFKQMELEGVAPNVVTYASSLKACSMMGATCEAQEIHVQIERQGLLTSDMAIGNTLVEVYVSFGLVPLAEEVLDMLLVRSVVSWNALLGGCIEFGHAEDVFEYYEQMQCEGVVPNAFTFLSYLKACSTTRSMDKGQEIHAKSERLGVSQGNAFLNSSLVDMYAECGALEKAQQLFDKLPFQDMISWSALIAGYVANGHSERAFQCFSQMHAEGVFANVVTLVSSLMACASIGATEKGKEIHAKIKMMDDDVERDIGIGNTLVYMYAECGSLAMARQVFDTLLVRDALAWAMLIAGYAKYGDGKDVLRSLECMQLEHADIEAQEWLRSNNLLCGNMLVDIYAKCGSLSQAHQVFDRLAARDVGSWNALMGGYAAYGHGKDAITCFKQMQLEGIHPDTITLLALLKACNSIDTANQFLEILSEVERKQLLERDILIVHGVINTLANHGSLSIAEGIFDRFPLHDAIMWTTLIAGYTTHDYNEEALNCLENMQLEGLSTTEVMLVCCLKACGSAGAITHGRQIHSEIEARGLLGRDFVGNTVVDMYAKCGLLVDAQHVFDKIPARDVVSWTALMMGYAQLGESKCVFHIFDRMRRADVKPDPVSFTVLMYACTHMGLFDQSEMYLEAMSKIHGIAPTLRHHTCLVDLLGRIGHLDAALSMLKEISCHPNLVTWTTVLSACRSLGHMELGKRAFDRVIFLHEEYA